MTEIRFLLDLVLKHKLPEEAQKACLERIGEVEEQLQAKPVANARPAQPIQAASTANLIEEQEKRIQAVQAQGMLPPALPMRGAAIPAKVAVGGEVQTGMNSRGPRKW